MLDQALNDWPTRTGWAVALPAAHFTTTMEMLVTADRSGASILSGGAS